MHYNNEPREPEIRAARRRACEALADDIRRLEAEAESLRGDRGFGLRQVRVAVRFEFGLAFVLLTLAGLLCGFKSFNRGASIVLIGTASYRLALALKNKRLVRRLERGVREREEAIESLRAHCRVLACEPDETFVCEADETNESAR